MCLDKVRRIGVWVKMEVKARRERWEKLGVSLVRQSDFAQPNLSPPRRTWSIRLLPNVDVPLWRSVIAISRRGVQICQIAPSLALTMITITMLSLIIPSIRCVGLANYALNLDDEKYAWKNKSSEKESSAATLLSPNAFTWLKKLLKIMEIIELP